MTADAIQAWLIARLAEALELDPSEIDVHEPLASYGLDSVRAISLSGDLEEWLGRPLSPTIAYEYPSIESLARFLAGEPVHGPAVAAPVPTIESAVGPVAVVGIGCRFPGADGPAAFWRLLREGVDAIAEVPPDRWDIDAYFDPDLATPGKMNTRWGGFLRDIDRFDPYAFGISPREAARMDPQQRLLLEVTWEALEDAGIPLARLAGSRTGVFVGISSNDYGLLQLADPALSDPHAGTGNALSIAANRVSYLLDLHGPSLSVDTACSSSLVAVHLACQSLRSGECDIALAGGVNVILSPAITVNFTKAGFMAPDGRCKAFDARADGYVRGEGSGMVVLKPLEAAQADGDRVYAVIRGSATNSDGRTQGLTAPNARAQADVLRAAYRQAGVAPARVRFVECHGTGTALGDPLEAQALGSVLADGRPDHRPLTIGSVKTNIGHLEAAAGIAALIKTALALWHRQLPPSLHFRSPNPLIPFEDLRLRVPQRPESLDDGDAPPVAGVSAFGFGGTNAHVVLEAPPTVDRSDEGETSGHAAPRAYLLPISAHTADAVRSHARSYIAFLRERPAAALRDICYTAAVRRHHHDHRLAVAGATPDALVERLLAAVEGPTPQPGRTATPDRRPKIAFVFSGQGPQWWGMGRELLAAHPAFRAEVERVDGLLAEQAGWSVLAELLADEAHSRLDRTDVAQPALLAIHLGLVSLWRAWGVEPDAVVGHSVGEIAAAHVAGILTLEDAVRVAHHRGRLMQRAAGRGKMAAVELPPDEIARAVADHGNRLWIAAVNSPTSVTVGGDPEAVDALMQTLRARGVFCRELRVHYAFHTPQMEPHDAEIEGALEGLRLSPAARTIVSTVTGRPAEPDDYGPGYWRRSIREPVQFASAVEALIEQGCRVFVEISPHPALGAAVAQCLRHRGSDGAVVASLRRGEPEMLAMLSALGTLYSLGTPVDWRGVYPNGGRVVALPSYPWQRERCWRGPSAGDAWRRLPGWTPDGDRERTTGLLDELFYDVVWEQREGTVPDAARVRQTAPDAWVLLADRRGVADALAARIRAEGGRCILARWGEALAPSGPDHVTLRPGRREDLDHLLAQISPEDAANLGVVHLWSLDARLGAPLNDAVPAEPVGEESVPFAEAQALACESVVHLIQSLHHAGRHESSRVWLGTCGSQATAADDPLPAPAGGLTWGLGRTMAVEQAPLWGGLIDLDPSAQARDAAHMLWDEIMHPDGEDQVAHRGGRRLAARLVHRRAAPVTAGSLRWRRDASYLVTGGLGDLGLEVASWMVRGGARRVVLLGRTPLPPREEWSAADTASPTGRRVAAIRALEASGASVHVARVDVRSPAQVRAFFERFRREGWPPIRGVIHAAGTTRLRAALETDRETLDAVLGPKAWGAWLLHEFLADAELDFCVYFSSLSALLGSPRLGGYAAANAFLDALAHHRRGQGLPGLSINWGLWGETGMAARQQPGAAASAWAGMSLGTREALEVMNTLLETAVPQAGVFRFDWALWRQAYPTAATAPYVSRVADVPPAGAALAPSPLRLDRVSLRAAGPDGQRQAVEAFLRDQVAAVLQIPVARLDVHRPLAALGLDSMMAVQLKNQIEDALGIEVALVRFLEGPSIAEIAQVLSDDLAAAVREAGPDLLGQQARTPVEEWPVSHGQRALWFLQEFAPHSAAYNVNLAARIRSPIDVDAVRRAFQDLVDRHAVLRATFPSRDGLPVAVIPVHATVAFTVIDASTWDEAQARTALVEDGHRPFDLKAGPVFRVTLYTRGPRDHLLLISVHHIVYDAASLVVLMDELGALYAAAAAGRPAQLPPPQAQYVDYVRWQQEMLNGPDGERLWAYWHHELAGELPDLALPTDRPRPPVQTFRGAAHVFHVDDDLTGRLKALASSSGTTLFVVLLAAFQALLHRYSGQDDLLVGVPMIGRTLRKFHATVGYFINPAVLRTDLSGDPTFAELMAQARRRTLGALTHQEYPFSLLVERLQPDRDASRSPLFQAMFNMPSALRLDARSLSQFVLGEAGGRLRLGGLDLELFPIEQHTAEFDLLLTMTESGGRLAGSLQYSTDLFDAATIERMTGHFLTLLGGIANDPSKRTSALPLLSDAERRRILVEWNATERPYPRDAALAPLFEAQVARMPDAVAAVCGDRRVTYREVNAAANRLARFLAARGVGRDVVVAVLAERSIEFLTAILGVFKAGGAYLPLDPRHPAPRHAQVLAQSRAPLVLVARGFLPVIEEACGAVAEVTIEVHALEDALAAALPDHNLGFPGAPGDLAYVIFTSGSTGTPKGAMVEQRGMINHLYAKVGDLRLTGADAIAQTASQCFDISVWQFLVALVVGGRVHIYGDDTARDPMALLDAVDADGITVLETVPSLLLTMVEGVAVRGADRPRLSTLRWMVPTGEALPPEVCRGWLRLYPEIPLVNAYGPTECSDDVTHHFIFNPPDADVLHMPIGRPIANTRLYILDAHVQPVPVGVIGELCVAGDGVGRGYLHDPARAAAVFVPDPFAAEPGARMYRTGDLARFLPDGTIEFLGRRDHQVKIRGFRIELGEIESVLDRHPQVRDCAVVARDEGSGRKRLVAYVVPTDGMPSTADLRGYLKERLPDYMVPSAFVALDALPLTPNGKVDRRALPAPEAGEVETDVAYVAPRTPTEAALAAIWTDLLGLPRVGIHDNFFAQGGDSILSIRILARAAQAGLGLTPTQFFQHQTVAEQAAAIDAAAGATIAGEPSAATEAPGAADLISDADRQAVLSALGPAAGEVEDLYPLTPMQAVMLAQTLRGRGSGVYVEQLSCTVRGAFDAAAFEDAWRQAVSRHAVLRTQFLWDGLSEPVQVVMRDAVPRWEHHGISGASPDARRAELERYLRADLMRGFDLAEAPPLRFALFRLAPDAHHFVWTIHHLLLDAWSGGVLLREVFDLYAAARSARRVSLDPPRPYREYVAWIRQQDPAAAEAHWRQAFAGYAVEVAGSTWPGPTQEHPDGLPYGEARALLPESATAALQGLARATRLTLSTIVQGAWALVLGRRTGRDDVAFGVTTSGRPAGLAGVESMVGLFINTLPLRARLDPQASAVTWLRRLQDEQAATRRFEHTALDNIHRWIGVPEDRPLFESVLRFQNFPADAALRARIGSLRLDDVRFTDIWAYPVCLVAEPQETLALAVTFDRRRITPQTAGALLEDLQRVLLRLTAAPEVRVSNLQRAVEAKP